MKIVTKELLYPIDGGPTPQCHASTLVLLPDGTVRAAWFGGTRETHPDVEIWTAVRSAVGEGIWENFEMLSVPQDRYTCWNPVLYAEDTPDGEHLILWFKRGTKIAHWQTFTRESFDGGLTWTEEKELVPGDVSGGRGPVKNKLFVRGDGTFVAGASHEAEDKSWWKAFFDLSYDGGKTWERTDYIDVDPVNGQAVKLIQPTIWESETGLHALLRSDAGYLYRCDSVDGGRTWSKAVPTSLPNNNSGVDLVRLPDGRVALVCNPVSENWGKRTPISLFLSSDDGATWEKALDLEASDGEYSYPAVICAEGRLHITFTYQRRSVMYCVVEPD